MNPHDYHSQVDAVSSATMTPAIILESLSQGEALFAGWKIRDLWPTR